MSKISKDIEGMQRIGPYILQQKVARGGMAELFLADYVRQDGFRRKVAVKRILPHLAGNNDFIKMFTREARLAALLQHPNIVQIFDYGKIENAYGGISEKETWGKRAAWCDYSGPVQERWIGAALFDHPDSFRYPTYWHVRDYGLMTANPFGISYFKNDPAQRGDFTLKQGAALCAFYRLYIHIGDATDGRVGAKYNDFVHPPEVEVE